MGVGEGGERGGFEKRNDQPPPGSTTHAGEGEEGCELCM